VDGALHQAPAPNQLVEQGSAAYRFAYQRQQRQYHLLVRSQRGEFVQQHLLAHADQSCRLSICRARWP
jgi:hypothetical protein